MRARTTIGLVFFTKLLSGVILGLTKISYLSSSVIYTTGSQFFFGIGKQVLDVNVYYNQEPENATETIKLKLNLTETIRLNNN